MGYITKEEVQKIRVELKTLFPKTKFSIVREHHSGVRIAILKSNIDFAINYKQVNECWIEENFEGAQREMLQKIYGVASHGTTWFETGDYGFQPSHYVWITIGQWDKDFQFAN